MVASPCEQHERIPVRNSGRHPRRCELAGAGLRLGRRDAAFVERADGPFVYDVEGRRYIDYVQSYGPSILGHAHPDVIAAIQDAATRGTSYGAPTENEVRIAEMTSRVEGLEMMRLVSSGTEAAMSAIRLTRGATGRSKILKFAGNYHGHTDSLLVPAGRASPNRASRVPGA